MATIAILTNQEKYHYHTNIAQIIKSVLVEYSHAIKLLDIETNTPNYYYLSQINSWNPDILITLDLSGFHFRTQSGENALNMLYTKNLNIIWGHKPEYAPYLSKKVSLSMLFYDASGYDNQLSVHYPNVLYYKTSPDYQLSLEGNPSSDTFNFITIWNHFLCEINQPILHI